MDSNLIAFAGIVLVAVLGGAFTLRGQRGLATQTGADQFRGDLLTRIGQQEEEIKRIRSDLKDADERIDKQGSEIERLRSELAEERQHSIVLTNWGKTVEGPPGNRTPPPWKEVDRDGN